MKPLLYVAGPYTKPDPVVNTHNACKVGTYFVENGFDVYVPHCNMVWHLVTPQAEAFWYANDIAVLRRCDVVFRILGESVGSDEEERIAKEEGIPVVYSIPAALEIRELYGVLRVD